MFRADKVTRAAQLSLKARLGGPVLGLSPLRRKNIAMIHLGRSGSTVVAKMLRAHPHLVWDEEIYYRLVIRPLNDAGLHLRPDAITVDPMALLERRMNVASWKRYGFEFKPFHLTQQGVSFEAFMARLDGLGFTHFVSLRRHNLLRIVTSFLVMVKLGQTHIALGDKVSQVNVHLNLNDIFIDEQRRPLVAIFESFEDDMARLDTLLADRKTLNLSYEEHIETDPRVAYGEICDFAGLRRQPVTVELRKTNPRKLSEIISNFDEVKAALAGTRWAWMVNG